MPRPNPNYRPKNQHGLLGHGRCNLMGLYDVSERVHDRSISHGSIPFDFVVDSIDESEPSDATPIELVRLLQAYEARQKPVRVDVNLCPFEEGAMAAMKGKGEKSNPYHIYDEDPTAYLEWLEGFESNYRMY